MELTELSKDNIKVTLINDEGKGDDCYLEILVNRTYLNTFILGMLLCNKPSIKSEARLTEREKEVLMHLLNGDDNKCISKDMNVSIHTTKIHIKNIFQKLQAKDRTEAVVKAIKYGIINVFN